MDIHSLSSPVTTNGSSQLGVKPDVNVTPVKQSEASVVSPKLNAKQETDKDVLQQVEQVNTRLEQLGLGIAFSVDENTQSSVVKVIDKTTDEVIKQFPNEGSLRMMKNIQDYLESVQQSGSPSKEGLTGVLFNEII